MTHDPEIGMIFNVPQMLVHLFQDGVILGTYDTMLHCLAKAAIIAKETGATDLVCQVMT